MNFPASDFAEESTYLLSISYLSRGDEEAGLQWFARLREGYPDGVFAAEALYRLGDAWANAGRRTRAAESYEEFLEAYPDRPEAARTRVALTRIKLEAGEPEEALAALEGFTTENISSPRQRSELRYEAETLRVDALIKLERFEEALASVEVADAAARLQPFIDEMPDGLPGLSDIPIPLPVLFGTMAVTNWLLVVAIPSMIAALLFRGGLLMYLFAVAVVAKNGSRASRLRAFWRSLVIKHDEFSGQLMPRHFAVEVEICSHNWELSGSHGSSARSPVLVFCSHS